MHPACRPDVSPQIDRKPRQMLNRSTQGRGKRSGAAMARGGETLRSPPLLPGSLLRSGLQRVEFAGIGDAGFPLVAVRDAEIGDGSARVGGCTQRVQKRYVQLVQRDVAAT